MSALAKLTIKSVVRTSQRDPVEQRRQKLLAGIEQQLKVAAAANKGQRYEVQRSVWQTNEQGEKVQKQVTRRVRAWFFEQDGGWYVQCKYGNKPLNLGKGGNAVFVKTLADVGHALQALYAAAAGGELDDAMTASLKKSK